MQQVYSQLGNKLDIQIASCPVHMGRPRQLAI